MRYSQREMVPITCSRRKGLATYERRNYITRFRRGLGLALMKAVIGRADDSSSKVVAFRPADFPAVATNRCSDYDLSGFTNGTICGSPLSWPCFDFSRCRDGPTIYVYDEECSLTDSSQIQPHGLDTGFRRAAQNAGVLVEAYESACLFINVNTWEPRTPQCAATAPLWNEGRNHVMFDLHDESRDTRPSYRGSYAIEAAPSQHTCYYRSGYDISVGHCPKVVFHELQATPPESRNYFLTFRGTLHLKFHGSEERSSIVNLHNDTEGVVVAEKCVEGDSRWRRAAAETCDEIRKRYDAYDYHLLMNSTFGLVPAGASPGTYRLGEVMSAGCIPVIVARDYIKPFTEEVDWSEFSFTFSPDEVPDIIRTLRSVQPEELKQMQQKSLEAYWKIYGGKNDYSMMIRHITDILVRRVGHHES